MGEKIEDDEEEEESKDEIENQREMNIYNFSD